MKFIRSGKLALMAGALCALVGLGSAPAQAMTIQQLSDSADFLPGPPNPNVLFGLTLAPETQVVASFFDVTHYNVGNAYGLTFTLNQAVDFSTLVDPGLSFGIFGISLGAPFIDHGAFFNGTPTMAPDAFFDVAGEVIDLDPQSPTNGQPISFTILSADGLGNLLEVPAFGELGLAFVDLTDISNPLVIPAQPRAVGTVTISAGAGLIEDLSFTLAFVVPEPGTLALVGVALVSLGLRRRRMIRGTLS